MGVNMNEWGIQLEKKERDVTQMKIKWNDVPFWKFEKAKRIPNKKGETEMMEGYTALANEEVQKQ